MAQDAASSITASTIRVTRLTPAGAPMVGEKNAYVTKAFISVSMTPEYEDGDEFTQKNAAGGVCVSYRTADTLKRVTLEVALCNPDPEFTEIISGGILLQDTAGGSGAEARSIGWLAPEIGVDALPNGVALEVWSGAVVGGRPAAVDPYWHWLFPYANMRQGGDRVIENGILATSFEGWAVGNAAFGKGGSSATTPWKWQSDRAYGFARTSTIPTLQGFNPVVAPTA